MEIKNYKFVPDREKDIYIRGIIPELNIRFIFANIKETLIEIRNLQNLSTQCEALLGEAIIGAFLLTSRGIKQEDAIISLQIIGDGPVNKILTYASSYGGVRGIIIPEDVKWDGELYKGKGKGFLQVNKFKHQKEKIYSSMVEMKEAPLWKNIEEYMSKSEQINTFIGIHSLFSLENSLLPVEVYGYLFEVLPDTKTDQIDKLIEFLNQTNMLDFLKNIFSFQNIEDRRSFRNHFKVEILQTGSIFFHCECNLEKINNLLFTLGEEEVNELLKKNEHIEITCEFCKRKYILTENDIKRLFKEKE